MKIVHHGVGPFVRSVLFPLLATRAALLAAGWLALHLLPSGLQLQRGNLRYHAPGPALLEMWARWDAEWYLLIAERGYAADDQFVGLPVAYQRGDDAGFFPLYPMLVRLVASAGVPALAAGVIVSNLALLLAAWLLHDLARRELGEEAAERSVWLLLSFPTSFFLSAVYAESTMLAALLGAIWLWRADRPLLAGAAGALCALSRPTGILVILPLGWEVMVRLRAGWRDRAWGARLLPPAAALLPPALALGGYMLFCRARFGSLAPFLERQERWRGATSGPWRAFVRYFEAPAVHGAHHSSIDLVVAIAAVVSIPFLFRKLRTSHALYGTAAILFPLGSTLWSFSRFAASIYPLHLLAALLCARSERRFAAALALWLPLAGLFMALYAAWWWVG